MAMIFPSKPYKFIVVHMKSISNYGKKVVGVLVIVLVLACVSVVIGGGILMYGTQYDDEYSTEYNGSGFVGEQAGGRGALSLDTPTSESFTEGEATYDEDDVSTGLVTPQDSRRIIKTGNVSMVVEDLDSAVQDVRQIARVSDGYVENLSDMGSDNSRTVYVTIKVPSDKFDTLMTEVKEIAEEVSNTSISTDDVSAHYTDLQSRLRNLEAAEEQMLSIMEKAIKISDILDVQKELTDLRGQIEQTKGQLQYFDRHTQYSTISVTMSLIPENLSVQDEKWRPVAVIKAAFSAFVGVLEASFEVLVWLVIFSPFVLIPVFLVKWSFKRAKRKKAK